MASKGLWQIKVSINKQFCIYFNAEKIEYNAGIGFIEKNPQKNIEDFVCIALYPNEKNIIFRDGVVMCIFDVKEGNLTDFNGDYNISFFEKNGTIRIEEVKE